MTSCAVHKPEKWSKPVVVKVNGVAIPRADIVREVQNHPAASPAAAWRAAARALVVRELLLQEMRKHDLAAEPLSDNDGRQETTEEAQVRALIARDVLTPEPDQDSCRRYYEQNRRRFRSPDIYEACHILFAASRGDAEAYARARAQATQVLAELQKNPQAFADLARAHSACPSGALGGNLGQIVTRDTTPEFERALVALSPGMFSPIPVETRYGFHIIRLDRKHAGRELPYEAVAERIADYLRERVERRAVAQYIARLAAVARIEGVDLADTEALRVH
jgi:peptidyl-prolyl cis-trans isomerase C